MRQGRSLPIAASPSKSPASPFSGDWPTLFGGNGARIRCHVRAPSEGGRVQLELFAGDIAQWACEAEQRFGPDWTEASVSLRYDWSDADAIAAGWHPSPAAFSWSETVANVGKVVIVPAASGALHSFDLDDIQVSGLAD
jgi:hypothetical protein